MHFGQQHRCYVLWIEYWQKIWQAREAYIDQCHLISYGYQGFSFMPVYVCLPCEWCIAVLHVLRFPFGQQLIRCDLLCIFCRKENMTRHKWLSAHIDQCHLYALMFFNVLALPVLPAGSCIGVWYVLRLPFVNSPGVMSCTYCLPETNITRHEWGHGTRSHWPVQLHLYR